MADYKGGGTVLILLGIGVLIEIFFNVATIGSYRLEANRVTIIGTLALAGFLLAGGLVVFFGFLDNFLREPHPKSRRSG
jgi:formate hydrogenlyase subunit 3/multisubunit Na+/H+ antiporter MnhD subunit